MSKSKSTKDKQRSTNHTYKTKDRETHLTVRYDRSLSTQFCRNIPLSPLPRDSILDTLLYVHRLNFRIEVYFWQFLLAFHSILDVKPIIHCGDYVLCFWTYLRRLCSVFLDVFEEIDFLCYCAYLRRLCSVLLHVSDETMFCVTARI